MKSFAYLVVSGCTLVVLLVAGCAKEPGVAGSSGPASSSAVSPRKSLLGSGSAFSHVTFNLPKGINWVQSRNTPAADGGGIAEWVPKGYTTKNSPLRVVYQKKSPGISSGSRLQEIIAPIKSCADAKITRFKGGSSYQDQTNVEVFCSKMGKNNWGLVSYVSVFSNQRETHVLIGELRTAPTKKAGVFADKTAEEKKLYAKTKGLSKLLFDMARSMRACGKNGKCR